MLVVDKPSGPTSHDVVASVRRSLSLRKVGHLGTLDPMATGVLPLVVGRATRLAPLFTNASKQYDAVIRLGLVTDTYDITGTTVGGTDAGTSNALPSDSSSSADEIRATAEAFVGSYPQRPPPVSAKKIGGVRAYEFTRRKQRIEIQPVLVTVESLQVLAVKNRTVRCRIVCSSGFYVRSLAHDLGARLGCGGCLETLRRERHGPFELADATPLEDILNAAGTADARTIQMGDLLPDLPHVTVTPEGARRATHGNSLRASDLVPGSDVRGNTRDGRVRVLDRDGKLLAIAEPKENDLWHPKIVLAEVAGPQGT